MSVASTSRQSLGAISMPRRKTMADEIYDTIRVAQLRGVADMSMREVQLAMEQDAARRGVERRVDMSSISGRVHDLVAARRLLRDSQATRQCTVTGADIHPLSIPPTQARLCN